AFKNSYVPTIPNINDWDVGTVTNMDQVFYNTEFNSPINDWDVGQVTTMGSMFFESPFDYPLDKWDVSKVENMEFMFATSQLTESSTQKELNENSSVNSGYS